MTKPAPPTVCSFIVPTKNSAATLAACLASINGQRGATVEAIVVDNFSDDETPAIAAELADRFEQAGPERSAQRNLGARLATSPYVVFIDSDMTLAPGLAADIQSTFEADEELAALVIPEFLTGPGYWERCREIEKLCYVGDESVEAARAFRRSAFEEFGGYDESLTGPEDWDLPDRLRAAGRRVGRTTAALHHHEAGLRLSLTFSKKRYYGRSLGQFAGRSRSQSIGRVLRPRFFGRLLSHAPQHPLLVSGVVALKVTEYAGALLGAAERAVEQRRRV
jgi:glycosyltransferase involved in cell wall biosynthesis